jgi:hypothetical protein
VTGPSPVQWPAAVMIFPAAGRLLPLPDL